MTATIPEAKITVPHLIVKWDFDENSTVDLPEKLKHILLPEKIANLPENEQFTVIRKEIAKHYNRNKYNELFDKVCGYSYNTGKESLIEISIDGGIVSKN